MSPIVKAGLSAFLLVIASVMLILILTPPIEPDDQVLGFVMLGIGLIAAVFSTLTMSLVAALLEMRAMLNLRNWILSNLVSTALVASAFSLLFEMMIVNSLSQIEFRSFYTTTFTFFLAASTLSLIPGIVWWLTYRRAMKRVNE